MSVWHLSVAPPINVCNVELSRLPNGHRLEVLVLPELSEGEQVILKFRDTSRGGGFASVVGIIQVVWYPSGQQSTERLDPT